MRLFLVIGLTIFSFNLLGYGLADWQHITPGGNIMGDGGNGTYLTITKNRREISGIKKWYFYKDNIIGEGDSEYFLVDEKSGGTFFFKKRLEWINHIKEHHLEPSIWTRWYTDNWKDGDYLFIWLIFLFFISIPFILFFLFAFYKAITNERFRVTKPYTIFIITSVLILGSTLVLDFYPQSI